MSQQSSPFWKSPIFISVAVVVVVIASIVTYLLVKPTKTVDEVKSNQQLTSIQDRFNTLTTSSNNTYQSLIDMEGTLQTALKSSKDKYEAAYSALKTKVKDAGTIYSNLLTNIETLNAQFTKYNSDVSAYTGSNLTIPDPSDSTFTTKINDMKTTLTGFLSDGNTLIKSYNDVSNTASTSIASLITTIKTDSDALKVMVDEYNAQTINGQTIVQKFNDSDALKNTTTLLESVDAVIKDSSKYTFTPEDQKIIDKITGSLTTISDKINKVIENISSYQIESSATALLADITNLLASVDGTNNQIITNIKTITDNITAITSRSGNLNYGVTALQKNIELNKNFNDIKSFFNSLYPNGVPANINI